MDEILSSFSDISKLVLEPCQLKLRDALPIVGAFTFSSRASQLYDPRYPSPELINAHKEIEITRNFKKALRHTYVLFYHILATEILCYAIAEKMF